jgi:hypothetical protein
VYAYFCLISALTEFPDPGERAWFPDSSVAHMSESNEKAAQRDRLDLVRRRAGINSVRGVWDTLGADDSGFSEAAVRDWHAGRRYAPARYLAAVSRTFQVSLDWLVTGEEPMTPGPTTARARRTLEDMDRRVAPLFHAGGPCGPTVGSLFSDVVVRLNASAPDWQDLTPQQRVLTGGVLERLVTGPVRTLRGEAALDPDAAERLDAYALHALLAFREIIPGPGKGIPWPQLVRTVGLDPADYAEFLSGEVPGAPAHG